MTTDIVTGQRDVMPDSPDLIRINAGPRLDVRFRPQWRHNDGIIRSSIYVALAGHDEQAWRGDAFSKGTHHHIGPVVGAQDQISIEVAEGRPPLVPTLAIIMNGKRFRQILCDAEKDETAGDGVTDEDLIMAGVQIAFADAAHPLAA